MEIYIGVCLINNSLTVSKVLAAKFFYNDRAGFISVIHENQRNSKITSILYQKLLILTRKIFSNQALISIDKNMFIWNYNDPITSNTYCPQSMKTK